VRGVQEDYRNTHLVLGRRTAAGYGVDSTTESGRPEQPFPQQVVRHVANMLRDAEKIGGRKRDNFLAFTLGWFSHVVSDALFKGVYPQTARVNFFGHQYQIAMLPAAEALTMTDISYDFGVHWPRWRAELLDDEPDGGALRHLAMGNEARSYDAAYWTQEFGKPDPAIGRVMDAVRPLNRKWFSEMYFTPDYTAPTPRLDNRTLETRGAWKFNGRDLGQVRAYAIDTGWYDTFIKGIDVYLRIVNEATDLAKLDTRQFETAPIASRDGGVPDWNLWQRILGEARGERDPDWGSRLNIHGGAETVLNKIGRLRAKVILPRPATDYQRQIAPLVREKFSLSRGSESLTIMIGSPAFNAAAGPLLCHEDMLRMKYDSGVAGFVKYNADRHVLHLVGLSDFGDCQLIDWLKQAR
jgi:hypothetical protein